MMTNIPHDLPVSRENDLAVLASAVEDELRQVVDTVYPDGLMEPYGLLHHMLAYHLGWEGEGSGPAAQGKRIRPILLLLTASAAGGDWQAALPAAAAVELIHNFSLIHDDIEDQSALRRGRPTVWTRWGAAQAINTGDLMFTLAHQTILRLRQTIGDQAALAAAAVLQDTCVQLTRGQFLDIAYETAGDFTLDSYWPMIEGKTAALLVCCTELGAITAGLGEEKRRLYREFGRSLGLAFQVQDDWLGIWGDPAITGKSTESDLVSGKKTLPVLFALNQPGKFAQKWAEGPVHPEEVRSLSDLLQQEGADDYTQNAAARLTRQALQALEEAAPPGPALPVLTDLALRLLDRKA